ncbi:MAG: ABC transporter permease [Acidobacteriia bacterium]|nr:ABC transporter permease [Terriglobia bacterium]
MRQLRAWFIRVINLFRGERPDHDIGQELNSHLQMHINDNLRAGMTPEEARRQALIKLGGVEQAKERYRERRGLPFLEALWQDLRFGARMLRKSPGFAAVAVLTLALGIGANTAIFSAIYSVLLRPLPFVHSDRLVALFGANPALNVYHNPLSYPDFVSIRDQANSFDQLAAYSNWAMNIGGRRPERLRAVVVTPAFFDVLEARALVGSSTLSDDRSIEPGVVISYALWQRYFGGDAHIAGRQIRLDRIPATVIGVMPPGFDFPAGVELWASLNQTVTDRDLLTERGSNWLSCVGRLQPQISLSQAQVEMDTIASRLASTHTADTGLWGFRLYGLHDSLVGDIRAALLVLLGAVGFVLLIACANLSSLLLARASIRQGEFAIRAALGASRARLLSQWLMEALLLAVLGGTVGIALAGWTIDLLSVVAAQFLPRGFAIRLDPQVLSFAVLLSLATALLSGLLPALHAAGTSPDESLRQQVAGSRVSARRARTLLVAGEIAISLVLLAGGGLLMRSFLRLRAVDPGFVPEGRVVFSVSRADSRGAAGALPGDFFLRLLDRLASMPGMTSAAATSTLPESGDSMRSTFLIQGKTLDDSSNRPQARKDFVTPGFFQTMGIPLIQGREFNLRDGRDSPPVIVISQEFARRFFPGEDPIGKVLTHTGPHAPPRIIVGVVGNVRHDTLDRPAEPALYIPMAQESDYFAWFVLRTTMPVGAVLSEVRRGVAMLDSEQPISGVHTMKWMLDNSTVDQRLSALLMSSFAALALLLVSVGVYGVVAYAVTQRTHEIGLRMALGASRSAVFSMVLGQGLRIAGIGILIGVPVALALTRLLRGFLFGVSTADPAVFVLVTALLAAIVLLASYVPARRATKVDPMVALRYE